MYCIYVYVLKRKVNEMLPIFIFPISDDKLKKKNNIKNDYDIFNKQLKVYKCPFNHQSICWLFNFCVICIIKRKLY